MKRLFENWQDTSWSLRPRSERSDEIVTIVDVIDHLSAQEAVDVNVLALTLNIDPGGTPAWEYDPERVAAASLMYPIIIVSRDKQYRYILDGNHRLQKAVDEEVATIKAKILDLDNPETPEVFKKMFGGAG